MVVLLPLVTINLGEAPCDLLLYIPPSIHQAHLRTYLPLHWLLGAQGYEQGGSLRLLPAIPAQSLLGTNKSL